MQSSITAILTELDWTADFSVYLGISDMRKLTELTAEERGISDLTGLETATNLVNLNLMDNHISDVTPLANLTQLTELWLNGNDITDISALADLKNLIQLNLNGNDVVDISPLTDLTHLIGLGLQANYITDISPLSGMKNLTQLNLNHNSQQLVDVTPSRKHEKPVRIGPREKRYLGRGTACRPHGTDITGTQPQCDRGRVAPDHSHAVGLPRTRKQPYL